MKPFYIRKLTSQDISACAKIVGSTPLWKRYGFTTARCATRLRRSLQTKDLLLCAVLEKEVLGFAWVLKNGAFGRSPYLRLLAVSARHRGSGVGRALLHAAESIRNGDLFLMVSDFNKDARRFYKREGYVEIGPLPDFALKGITEILMRKQAG